MMKKTFTPEELKPTPLTVTIKAHILTDLKQMQENTKQPIDELVTKALQMFIATHNDYLGRNRFQ